MINSQELVNQVISHRPLRDDYLTIQDPRPNNPASGSARLLLAGQTIPLLKPRVYQFPHLYTHLMLCCHCIILYRSACSLSFMFYYLFTSMYFSTNCVCLLSTTQVPWQIIFFFEFPIQPNDITFTESKYLWNKQIQLGSPCIPPNRFSL